jgi:hypothetical protein
MRQLIVIEQLHEKFNTCGNTLSCSRVASNKDDKVFLSWKTRYLPSSIMVKDLNWRLD